MPISRDFSARDDNILIPRYQRKPLGSERILCAFARTSSFVRAIMLK